MFRINNSKVFLYSLLAPKVGFYFLLLVLVDLGPGAAVSGMRIEINTAYSCYLTAARRRQGQFFSLVDLILGGICHLP